MDFKRQEDAFRLLFSRCLNVAAATDELLVIHDESMDQFLDAFDSAVEAGLISCTRVRIPRRYQEYLVLESKSHSNRGQISLPSGTVAAVQASTAIVNLLDGTSHNQPVRKAVNQTPRPNNCRLATIPGISEAILRALLDAPFDHILRACEEVAWALGEGSEAEIATVDSSGKHHLLTLKLGGWENEPIMSPGVLLPGSWGNVPPGETFCCPPSGTVNGSICINGSVPRHVLEPREEIVLEFVNGKLISWSAVNQGMSSPALEFFEEQKRAGAANGDDNWNTFAELGIGLNPQITQLTGNPLFDEKAIETVHIAIGDNAVFGDDISSFIHADLITRRPSIRIDDLAFMDHGVIDHRGIQQRRTTRASVRSAEILDAVIHLREGRIAQFGGTLMRRLSKAQRVNFVRIGSSDTIVPLTELCETLRAHGRVHIAAFLKNYPSFGAIKTTDLLNILYHYRVLGVQATSKVPQTVPS